MASKTPRIDALNSAAGNLIINGNMDFSQRHGTSRAATAPDWYMTDRFQFYGNAGTAAFDWSADVPTLAQSGFQSSKSLKLTVGTTTNSLYTIRHILEGYDYARIHGQPVRLQFWVKSSIAGTYSISFINANTATRGYSTTYTINTANTWEKKTIDLTMDTAAGWLFDNSWGLGIYWHLGQNSGTYSPSTGQWMSGVSNELRAPASGQVAFSNTASATFYLSQVALIPGSYSSSADLLFVRAGRTIQQELAMCQRYFYTGSNATTGGLSAGGLSAGGTSAYVQMPAVRFNGGHTTASPMYFPVSMRAAPSIYVSDGTNAGKIFSAAISNTTAGSSNQTPPSNADIQNTQWQYISGSHTFPNAGDLSTVGMFIFYFVANAELT